MLPVLPTVTKISKMGNDIKLPNNPRKSEQSENTNAIKEELINEIQRFSHNIEIITQQCSQLEHKLKQINDRIGDYKKMILEQCVLLEQIQSKQLNMSLTRDNYIHCCEGFMEELLEINSTLVKDNNEQEYSESNISELQNQVILLNNEVAKNEEIIYNKLEKLS